MERYYVVVASRAFVFACTCMASTNSIRIRLLPVKRGYCVLISAGKEHSIIVVLLQTNVSCTVSLLLPVMDTRQSDASFDDVGVP